MKDSKQLTSLDFHKKLHAPLSPDTTGKHRRSKYKPSPFATWRFKRTFNVKHRVISTGTTVEAKYRRALGSTKSVCKDRLDAFLIKPQHINKTLQRTQTLIPK